MMNNQAALRIATRDGEAAESAAATEDARLDQVFAALSDPIRRKILQRLDRQSLLVSELASPFNVSLQAVSRHIQVLVRAGLVQQERTGRINRCSLEAGPLFEAAVWLNHYTKYWQEQFNTLAAVLTQIDADRQVEPTRAKKRGRSTPRK
jgi:DNA-binding transcriptional ArsR family regulator